MLNNLIYIAQDIAEGAVPSPTPTPTPYPEYLEYHYLTNYFSGDMEFWSAFNIAITGLLSLAVLGGILFWKYKKSSKR